VKLLDHKTQSCLCCSGPLPWAGLALGISFHTFHKRLATPCWGFANGRPLSVAPSCFLPAVCESNPSREQGLLPSTKNGFHQLLGHEALQWGLLDQGPEGREELATVADGIWPRADVECLLQYAFSLLISS